MRTYHDSIERYRKTLEIAVKYDAVPMILETLVRVAELFDQQDERELATQIVTLTLCYPMRQSLKTRARELLDQLEVTVCPGVIADAVEMTARITLDEMVEAILVA